jgi:hypothetical protein
MNDPYPFGDLHSDDSAGYVFPTTSSAIDSQTKQLAAMAYGEASTKNDSNEMMAIASVLVRQRDARGYSDMEAFVKGERSFSFVASDGNKRYRALMKASDDEIARDAGMREAVEAARNALRYGPDKSNGAYFWDGADIKVNYTHHAKVKRGIKFIDPKHDIYGIKESKTLIIKYKYIKVKNMKSGKVTVKKEEVGRYDHIYESTAGIGGTIFWKFGRDYLNATHAKPYK